MPKVELASLQTAPAVTASGAAPERASLTPAVQERQSGRNVDQAVKQAADAMFKGQEVEVRGFLDDGSGRFVYRISDKNSGEVLAQTPPDALLRFFASYEGAPTPLVSVDA